MQELRENLPLYTVILIALSLLRLIFYYSYFGIDIVAYIDPSEALLLALPYFIYTITKQGIVLVIVLLIALIWLVVYVTGTYFIKGEPGLQRITAEPTSEQRSNNYPNIIFFLCIVILIIGVAVDLYSHDYTRAIDTFLWVSFLTLNFTNRFRMYRWMPTSLFKSQQVFNIYYFTLLASLLFVFLARNEAELVLKGKHRVHVSVLIETGEHITTSSTLRYVGKTKGYIFFYNTNENKAVSYPLDKATEVNIIDSKPL